MLSRADSGWGLRSVVVTVIDDRLGSPAPGFMLGFCDLYYIVYGTAFPDCAASRKQKPQLGQLRLFHIVAALQSHPATWLRRGSNATSKMKVFMACMTKYERRVLPKGLNYSGRYLYVCHSTKAFYLVFFRALKVRKGSDFRPPAFLPLCLKNLDLRCLWSPVFLNETKPTWSAVSAFLPSFGSR